MFLNNVIVIGTSDIFHQA